MRFIPIAILSLGLIAHAQTVPVLPTTCPANAITCAQVTWIATAVATTVTNSSAGTELSGPATGFIWRCNGGPTNCSATNLTNNSAGYWDLIGEVPLTSTAGSAADTSIVYSASYYYSIADQWTGGTMSAFTAPFSFQANQAPPQITPTPGTVNVVQKP